MLSRHFAVPAEELEVRLPVGCIGRCWDERPQPRDVSLEAENGRGLLLVESLAAAWGSAPDPAGKVVWFEAGSVTTGYLPAWAEDDPSETDVPLDQLPARLADINHRTFFEGTMIPLTTTDAKDDSEEDALFEGSIDCNPYDPDPRLRVPVVNIQVCLGHHILGLDPQELTDIAVKLRAQADRLHDEVLPALIAAREDWTAQ